MDNVTFSSDGNGSMPIFDDKGNLTKAEICCVKSLYEEVKECIEKYNIPIEEALKVITSNVAKVLKLKNKGAIKAGKDADLVLVDEKTLEIKTVIAMGKIMIKDGKVIVKGTFEE